MLAVKAAKRMTRDDSDNALTSSLVRRNTRKTIRKIDEA